MKGKLDQNSGCNKQNALQTNNKTHTIVLDWHYLTLKCMLWHTNETEE